ncbi:hypothetical protein Tco_0513573 [Tanacetum coccineum]
MQIQVTQDRLSVTTATENGVAVDEEKLLFIAADDCDAFDSDVDEAPTAQTMFMANLSSADPIYDEAIHEMHDDVQPNYIVDSHADYMSDSNMILYDQYAKDNAAPVVQKSIEIESLKSSTHHSSINEFVVINIPEEDVKPKQIILDPDDQPMWEIAKTIAPTPNSAIIQLDVDDNFVINSTHLKMILENKFDGYLRADPHDHIREFLAICNMFKYGET